MTAYLLAFAFVLNDPSGCYWDGEYVVVIERTTPQTWKATWWEGGLVNTRSGPFARNGDHWYDSSWCTRWHLWPNAAWCEDFNRTFRRFADAPGRIVAAQ